jgi:hypothetical protein
MASRSALLARVWMTSGFAAQAGGTQMDPKAFALPAHVVLDGAAVQAVVVEPGLADADHARVGGQLHQFLEARLAHALVVGVHADRGPQLGVLLGQRQHLRELLQRGADADGLRHLRRAHLRQQFGELLPELGKAEVAMRVDEHPPQVVRSSASASTRRCWCPAVPRSCA